MTLVSQFTLFGHLKKGNKPDFHEAADAVTARRVYDYFYQRLRESYKPERVKNGVFQAMMDVELKNDGPVCVLLSCPLTSPRLYRRTLTLRSALELTADLRYRSPSKLIRSSRKRKKSQRRAKTLGRRPRVLDRYNHWITCTEI